MECAVEMISLRDDDGSVYAEKLLCAGYRLVCGKSAVIEKDILIGNPAFECISPHCADFVVVVALIVAREEKLAYLAAFIERYGGFHPVLEHMRQPAVYYRGTEHYGIFIALGRIIGAVYPSVCFEEYPRRRQKHEKSQCGKHYHGYG